MNMQAESDSESEEGGSANAVTISELLSFVRASARRHARVGLIVAASILVPGLTIAAFVPVKYEANSRIFVDETATKTEALSTPNRALPNLDPVSGTYELLMQKSTLVSLVKETGLLENWEATRSFPMRMKDKALALIFGQPTVNEKSEALADMLANNIALVKEKSLVRIRVTWTDRVFTLKLARLAQNKFIDLVRTRETGAFSSAISILEDERKHAEEAIEPALNEAVKAREMAIARAERGGGPELPAAATAAPNSVTNPVPPAVRRTAAAAPASSEAVSVEPAAQMASARLADLTAKIKAVEEPWHRRQAELASRLNESRIVYGEEHPLIVQQKEQIKGASVPPPELVELNKAKAELLEAIKRAPAVSTVQDGTERKATVRFQGGGRPLKLLPAEAGKPKDLDEDPVVATAKAGLRRAIEKYNQLTERLESARLQSITAQAAFNSRLVVTGNPQLPRKPIKPLPAIISISAVLGAALFGALAGALKDLASGRIHELWQVKPLGLKPLGEVWIARRSEP